MEHYGQMTIKKKIYSQGLERNAEKTNDGDGMGRKVDGPDDIVQLPKKRVHEGNGGKTVDQEGLEGKKLVRKV